MKKEITFIILFLLLISCKNESKEIIKTPFTPQIHNGVFVKGNINLPNNAVILLQDKLINKKYKTVATTEVSNSNFSFTKNITEEKLYYIGFNDSEKKIPFIANKYDTFITIDYDKIEDAKIVGSSIQQDYAKYLSELDKAKNKFVYRTNYIKSNSNSILSAIILKQMLGNTKWRLDQNKKAFDLLTSDIKNSNLGKEISKFIDTNEPLVAKKESIPEVILDSTTSSELPVKIVEKKATSTATINPTRKKVPNFYAESINGNDISLNSVIKGNKVVLIDFWASWCAPCRAQNPHLKRIYKKYHKKGFDIIGVSEDKYKDTNKWKNAVTTDGLPWHQVIDDNKRVAKMFGVKSIPHTVLLDGNGGIILNKKSPYTIEQKLKEIFGY